MLVARLKRMDSPEHQAGIVDEAIEAAESSRRFGDEAFARIRVGDIAFHGQRLAAGGLYLARERLRLLPAGMVADCDARALIGEASGDSGPYARGGAGYQHSLAGEIGNDEAVGGLSRSLFTVWRGLCRRRRRQFAST